MIRYGPLLIVPAAVYAAVASVDSSSSPSSSSTIILGNGVPGGGMTKGIEGGEEEEIIAGVDCSRSQSRLVRDYLEKEIWPLLQTGRDKGKKEVSELLPADCPLNPALDLYEYQEKQKTKLKGSSSKGHWKCEICGKVFRNEMYLDKHMDLKHHDKLNLNADTCLADFCPVFGCSYKLKDSATSTKYGRKKDKTDSTSKKKFTNIEPCTEADVQQRRNQCEAIAESCFHANSGAGHRAESFFVQNVCHHLSCVNGMLKGTIQEHDEQTAAWNMLIWVLRCLSVVVVLVFLSIYVFTEKVYLALMSSVNVFFGGTNSSKISKAPQMNNKNKSLNQMGNWLQHMTGTKKSSKKSM